MKISLHQDQTSLNQDEIHMYLTTIDLNLFNIFLVCPYIGKRR